MVQAVNNIEQSGSEEFEELLNLHEIYHALNAAASVNNLGDTALLAIQGAIVSLAEEGAPRADIVDIMSQILLFASDSFDISGIAGGIQPRMTIKMTVTRASGEKFDVDLLCRIDTLDEVEYYRHGGILPYVLRGLLKAA